MAGAYNAHLPAQFHLTWITGEHCRRLSVDLPELEAHFPRSDSAVFHSGVSTFWLGLLIQVYCSNSLALAELYVLEQGILSFPP